MTLVPGDIISTGTPAGIGPLAAGRPVTVEVAGVGELTNPVGQETTDERGTAMKFFIDYRQHQGHRSAGRRSASSTA